MMNINDVIKYPLLTEKTYAQMSKNIYTFAVDFRTNKSEVKKVVEHIFDVKVEKVNIMTVQKKAKKVGRYAGFTNRYKKAIVTLAEGTINLFPEEAEEVKSTKKTVAKKETSTEMSEAEKRAAAKIAAKAKEATAPKAKT
ncbi:MAG: 50S ribosomal protein L23, partial [Mycoplasmataceae bacterium]|nr:50S ribosomal protein L23 [Mycoplasmataceae bacterium]